MKAFSETSGEAYVDLFFSSKGFFLPIENQEVLLHQVQKGDAVMSKIILVLSAFFLVLFFNQEGSGQVYKYIDKDGGVHFTDNPTDSKYREAKGMGWSDSQGNPAPENAPVIKSKKWPQPEDFEIRKFNKPKPKK